MGGGFGSGLRPQFEAVLAVLAARALRRSVRVVLTRPQMYVLGYRPAMIQRIALGANAGGSLDAITDDAITVTSQYEDFHRQPFTRGSLAHLLRNRFYMGEVAFKGEVLKGEQPAILDTNLFEAVQAKLE